MITQKALITQHPSEVDCFTTCGLLTTSICWEAELQQFTERPEKTAAAYGMEISSDKNKILVNSIKPRLSINVRMN